MHQPQAYVAQNPVEYIAVQNCHKYAPARTLPSAPTLPSTPAMSRPGSAGSSVVILASPRPSSQRVAPQDFNLVMNGKEVAGTVGLDRTLLTPTTPPLSTESSRWGTPMADPMLSGLDAGASKPGPVYTQAEPQVCIDYFNGKLTNNPTNGIASTPTTPGLTPDPASPQATFCNPRDLSVSAQPSPSFVPSQPCDFAFDASVPTTPLPAAPLPESPPPQSLTTEDWALLNDEPRDCPETPVEKPETKPPRDMAPSTPDQPAAKKVKNEDGASPTTESEDVNAEEPNVIPGPPPQNRRGRKQSFSNDPTKQFVCRICDRRFRRQEHLKRHHRSLHTRDKPFKCDECGKTFSRSDNLAQHHRTHGSGNIPLDVAGAQFPSQSQAIQPMNAFAGLLFQVGATIPGGNGPQVVDPTFNPVPDGLAVLDAPPVISAEPHTGLVPI